MNTTAADRYASLLDRVLDVIEEMVEPELTSAAQSQIVADDIMEHLKVHLATELEYIAGGSGDGFTESGRVHKLRNKHRRNKRHQR